MAVVTGKVAGRRELHFESLDELQQEAERLADGEIELLGNWSLAQILNHLTITMTNSLDGFPFRAPIPMRLVMPLMRLFMKKRFLTKSLPAGFQIPKNASAMVPGKTSTADALAALQAVIERLNAESKRSPNPFLGSLSVDEWNHFHLRHAEMHLSFATSCDCDPT